MEYGLPGPASDGDEVACGVPICGWTPGWLQRFATVNTYALLWGLLGLVEIAINSYLGAIVNTLEKSFELTTTTSGVILSSFEVSMLVCTILLNYLGSRGHKPRWVSAGAALLAAACFSRLLLFLVLGPGQRALALTREHGALDADPSPNNTGRTLQLCGAPAPDGDCPASSGADSSATPSTPTLLLIASQLLMGAGSSLPLSLGLAYMDDNAPKNQAPLLIAASQFVRMLGPTVGYLLAYYSLGRFVAPGLTPLIDETDPRWIGAWWIGWAPLSAFALLLSALLLMFPREMPASRRRSSQSPRVLERSLADFWKSTRRLLGNRLMMCNTFSSVLFMYGMSGSWVFSPKYMEAHFQLSSSTSSLVLGSFGLVSTALGLAASGVAIWRFQPRPRALAAWNVAVELTDAFVRFSWTFIGCVEDNVHGVWTPDGRWNVTSECNSGCSCGPHVEFSPVCGEDSGATTFFSPCHAGCSDLRDINGTTMFGNCSCVAGSGTAKLGPCPTDCAAIFTVFLVTQSVLQFLEASGRAGNSLLHFRCVDEIDKAQAIAFAEVMLTGLAYIPAPIIYGIIIDSTCLVWSETCGSRGNCWLYDTARMRHAPNLIAAGFLLLGTFLDIGVWYYAKDVRLYDQEENATGDADRSVELSTLAAVLS